MIELLVTVAIIGLLSAVVLVGLRSASQKARDSKRKADIKQLMNALEMYYNANGDYPAPGGASHPSNGWSNSADGSWDTLQTKVQEFMSTLPKDPKNETGGWAGDGKYNYIYFSDAGYGCPDRRWYLIVYKLENPDMASPGVYACDGTFFNYSGTITIGINGVL
ncbi:MAG: hypothetical protein COV69_02030 [Parcubacteria group bacterium CG11_big_fil_rev_8_21_14_0_20_39_14]|nr:MAG: hypothetical protein COV69_02030 [Parcubacteria group bacterium CG11_big_fil_rev_8_21_14_0_20_39_14]PIS35678.1 MAG: hypothetical protein COT36_01190 [Parcubacteria group bacterium CG08_land_8_20_14_0_20_38_56]